MARNEKGCGRRLPLPCVALGGHFVRKVKQVDRSIHVGRLRQIDADPAAFGKNVVGFGTAGRHQSIADFFRKGDVHQAVAMYVADFSPSEAILRPAEAVGTRGHILPALHGVIDSFFRS